MSFHSCRIEKCTGSRYQNLHCICKFCHEKVFVECLREKDETTKLLLELFGLLHKNENDFLVLHDLNKYPEKVNLFDRIFCKDSPFGITCGECDRKFRVSKLEASASIELNRNSMNSESGSNHSNGSQQIPPANHSNGSQQIPPANSTLNQTRAPLPLRVPTSESNNNGNLENHKQLRISLNFTPKPNVWI